MAEVRIVVMEERCRFRGILRWDCSGIYVGSHGGVIIVKRGQYVDIRVEVLLRRGRVSISTPSLMMVT